MPDEPVIPASEPASEPAPVTPVATPVVPTADPPATPAAAPTPVAEPISISSVIGPDGKFLDNWKDSLPEEIRHEKSLDMVTDLPGAMKQLVNAQKMIGKDKIVIPGEGASQEEKDAFQIALGRPETKDGYTVEIPDDLKDVFGVEESQEMAFALGLSQETFNKAMELRALEERAIRQANLDAEQNAFDEAERIVVAQAGEALEEQKHLANTLIANNVPEKTTLPDGTVITGQEYKERLLAGLNDNAVRPYVFNFLANIQRNIFGQHGGIPAGDAGGQGAMTPVMMEARANEIMNIPGYADGKMKNSNPFEYKRLTEERTDLYNRIQKAQQAAQ